MALRRRTPLRRGAPLQKRTAKDKPGAERARAERDARRLERARAAIGERMTAWEETFLGNSDDGVATRLLRHGRGWANPALAEPSDPQGPLSRRQRNKLAELEAKAARAQKTTQTKGQTMNDNDKAASEKLMEVPIGGARGSFALVADPAAYLGGECNARVVRDGEVGYEETGVTFSEFRPAHAACKERNDAEGVDEQRAMILMAQSMRGRR